MTVELPSWLRGRALLGQYQDDHLVMATDALGQLYIVIRGVYGIDWAESYDSPEKRFYSLAVYDGKLYAGSYLNGKIEVYDGETWAESYDSDANLILSLTVYDGKLYAGSGWAGKVFVYDGERWAVSYDSTEASIYSLGIYDGRLYAGSSEGGKIFVYDGDSWAESYDTGQAAVLGFGGYEGKLYASTSVNGKIFVYDGVSWAESYDSTEGYIFCLTVYDGKLYAGTGSGGKVLVYDGVSWAESYDSDETYLRALAVYEGRLYAAGGDGGKVFSATTRYRTLSVDKDGQLIMVPRGQSGNYMLVDADGYLAAMFKAEFQGSPYNVACDADGRLKFFLTDNVDQWGEYLEVGNAELAARVIGCPVAVDRRGQVIYRTDFSDGQGAWNFTTAVGGAGAMRATDAIQGTNCIQLDTAADASSNACAGLVLPSPVVTSGIGFAFWFTYGSLPNYWRIRIRLYDGSYLYDAYIKGLASDGKLYAYNDTPGETEIGTWDVSLTGNNLWHYIKFCIDLDTQYYIRCILDGEEIDLSAVQYRKTASSFRYLDISWCVLGVAANTARFLLDCPCITVRET